MATLPHQISFGLIGSHTSTNKNTNCIPCIAQLHNKKSHFGKPKLLLSPSIALVGHNKKPMVMSDLRAEQWQSEKWKAWCNTNDEGTSGEAPHEELSPQHSLVLQFYDAFNKKDIQRLQQLLSPHHCSYHDLLFYGPYEGTQSVLNFLHNAMDALGPNVQICLEDVEEHKHFVTTVFWHLEWKTKKLPFTKGCRIFEFEDIEGSLRISKITGLEQLPLKPGELVLKLLKSIRTLFDNYPPAAEAILDSHFLEDNTSPHGGIDTHFDLFGRKH